MPEENDAKMIRMIPIFCLLSLVTVAQQGIDHWETAVLAEDDWRFRLGNSEPPADWRSNDFNDLSWLSGPGGFGYGDGDDRTLVSPTVSLYLRRQFEIVDRDQIQMLVLHADYDDAFVAYLNGVEIARANVGRIGRPTPFNMLANGNREAEMYQGKLPQAFAVYQPRLDSILTSGKNTLAIQIHNQSTTSSDMTGIFFLSLGIRNSERNYQPVPTWFYTPFESSNLPVMIINTRGEAIPNEPKIQVQMGIIDNGPGKRNFIGDAFNGYDGAIGIEIRGSSSQSFPKKNYGMETRTEAGDNANVSLLGMPEENDWVLHGPYTDKSLLRNVLAYHIGSLTSQYTPRTRLCELMINTDYRGLYVLTERIKRDKNRVDISRLRPEDIEGDELTGGYILQIDRDDPGIDDGWWSSIGPDVFYKFDDPDFDEIRPEQKNYIQNYIRNFELAMDGPQYNQVWDQYIDLNSFVDYWIVNEVGKHIDAFKLSFFIHKKKDSNGGKLHMGPLWDFNLAFGNFDFGHDAGPNGWSYRWVESGTRHPFWVSKLLTIPAVQNAISCRWTELRQGSLGTDNLLQFLDQNTMRTEEARQRNFQRWPVLGQYVWPNFFVGNNYDDEIRFLKGWLTNRLNWMDTNMLGACTTVDTDNYDSDLLVKTYPNPFGEEVSFVYYSSSFREGTVKLYDVLGREVSTVRLINGQASIIPFQNQAAGIYFYRLYLGKQIVRKGKVVKH